MAEVQDLDFDLNQRNSNRNIDFLKQQSSKLIKQDHSPENQRFKKSSVDFMVSSLAEVNKKNKRYS